MSEIYDWGNLLKYLGSYSTNTTETKNNSNNENEDLELLNLLKGYLSKYVEHFFENPDEVVREALKARDEEINRLNEKIKELESKLDILLQSSKPIPPISPWDLPKSNIWYTTSDGNTI